jgi:colicin import membrane protein
MRGGFFDNIVAAVLSLLLHLAMGSILLVNLSEQAARQSSKATLEPMIQAVVIDQVQLTAQMERRRAEREARQRAAEEALMREQEAVRLQAEAEAQAEAQRQEEARIKAEAEAQRREEARLQAEAEAQAEAQRQAEVEAEAEVQRREEARLQAEAEAQAETQRREEARLQAEAEAQAEAQRQAEVEAEAEAEAEVQRQAEESRQLAEFRQQLQTSLNQEVRNRQVQVEIERYTTLIKTRVERNWLRPPGCQQDLFSRIRIVLGSDDNIESVEIVESSGNANCDRYIEAAVLRAAPLPLPSDEEARAAFRSFYFQFNPGG